MVIDDALQIPPDGSLEVRSSGLWTELAVQQADDHFTVDLEAFGVDVAGETQLSALMHGVRVAVGCELSFETLTRQASPAQTSYGCRVVGDLLIGADVIALDALGWRSHRFDPAPAPTSEQVLERAPTSTTTRGWAIAGATPEPILQTAARSDSADHRLVFAGPDGSASNHGARWVAVSGNVAAPGWTWNG